LAAFPTSTCLPRIFEPHRLAIPEMARQSALNNLFSPSATELASALQHSASWSSLATSP
jgi:hypothetical protein